MWTQIRLLRSSLIWVHKTAKEQSDLAPHCLPVCKNRFKKFARIFGRRHKQMTFSDADFLGSWRVKPGLPVFHWNLALVLFEVHYVYLIYHEYTPNTIFVLIWTSLFTVFTLSVWMPQLLTILVLKFEQVQLTTWAQLFKANDIIS